VDTRALKEQHDLRTIVEQDLGPAPIRSGRTSAWKCPFHHERQGYSLVVWPDGYQCFGKCQLVGDALDWLQRYRRLSFHEALRVLGDTPGYAPTGSASRPTPPVEPPPAAWQTAAGQVVERAEDWLWQAPGEYALAYLLEARGLEPRTIREARLGVVPGGYRQWRTIAGVSVPCGITIPWFTGETLWAVKVRRESGQPKYVQIPGGSSGGLYRGEALESAQAVLFTEGEFDALVAHQEAGSLVTAVSLGSASATLQDRWLLDLVTVPLILAAYDMDKAGTKGAARLQALSQRVHIVPVPQGKDITEYHLKGGDVYGWLDDELNRIRENAILSSQEQ
jgi:DNA primase